MSQIMPKYLQQFVVQQNPSLYTAIDHASWRYIMKLSQAYFKDHAHSKYLAGLKETGISLERIPLIEEMDQRLSQFGWRTVAVSGFIPPAVFLEFLSLGILPVACDMRPIEHISYTPAPDIVHEAAGHAPIIADPNYARYLRSYGEIARKTIFSDEDMDVYEAIRNLSEVKENPRASKADIEAAEKRLDEASAAVSYVSEATELSRMGWWTIEYGLVGPMDRPMIYGAGLLSSVGESFHCLSDEVKKIPLTLDCINYDYDITRPQPQLFVTPDFDQLGEVLQQFAKQMAYQLGGTKGLEKAKKSKTVTTAELNSGIQISGVLADFIQDHSGNPIYLQFKGPSQLAFAEKELPGHGAHYHKEGYGTPVGKIKKRDVALNRQGTLEFETGVLVQGSLTNILKQDGKEILFTFENCRVSLGDKTLFDPAWGTFDMAVGERVVSVFGNAADRGAYLDATGGYSQQPGQPGSNLTPENRDLIPLYARVRDIREKNQFTDVEKKELDQIFEKLEKSYPKDWLLRYELLELSTHYRLHAPWESAIRQTLAQIQKQTSETESLISRGMALIA